MQSAIKRSLLAAVMLVVGLLIGVLSRNAMSQHASNSAAPSAEVGRYQIFPCGNSPDPNVYFLDTKTGRTWLKGSSTGNAWVEDTPPLPKSK